MIGLDTSILVRFLVQDDPGQGALAGELLANCTAESPGFVCREVLVEVVWVLERAYKFPTGKVVMALDLLLSAEELIVEASDEVALAAERYHHSGTDFADQMIALCARRAGCKTAYTFNKKASLQPGFALLDGG